MAFNFNWSPLIADTDRVREMLTSSLNKSPKPPIIVDDIIVNELNLGSTPPVLDILEIGDLAADRFRGIFKMSYTGDAYLTLKTRVQANPLNTYLSTKPSFASPQPLAASSGLTIPLQITLSDIRLSGFVILVFSRQKGITLVFRNDPLDSLKVSSTFDSIPFVRDYLQRTIESQLRILFMEDLPAIIHRLSLRVFSPEYQIPQNPDITNDGAQAPIDPFASPAQQATGDDALSSDGLMFSLEAPMETYATFSQKNLLRLAALSESQRTLSLFTPGMRDTVYRAWASVADRDLGHGAATPFQRPATLSRVQSSVGRQGAWSSTASQTSDAPSHATRPSITSLASAPSVYTLGSGRTRTHAGRKRKNRIVNLRKDRTGDKDASDVASMSSGYTESQSASQSASISEEPTAPSTVPTTASGSRFRDGEVFTPESSPKKKVGFETATKAGAERLDPGPSTIRQRPVTPRTQLHPAVVDDDPTPRASMVLPARPAEEKRSTHRRQPLPHMQSFPERPKTALSRSGSESSMLDLVPPFAEGSTGGILEQAWMMKMATEIAKKVAEEKEKQQHSWRAGSSSGRDDYGKDEAPPAYVS